MEGIEAIKFLHERYKEIENMNDEELLKTAIKIIENSPQEILSIGSPIVTFVPEIVYCRDCIHRPVYDEEENDLIVPPYNNGHQDCACPYICEEDFYLSKMPDKDFYCKFGEKK